MLWIRGRNNVADTKKLYIYSLALIVCSAAVIIPWTVRNYKVQGRFVLISTNGGLNLYQGVSRSPGKIFDPGTKGEKIWAKVNSVRSETKKNDIFMQEAIKIYKTKPLFALKMLVVRFLFFWNMVDWEILGGDKINYHFLFILPFAVWGTVVGVKNNKNAAILPLLVLYFCSFVLLFPGTPRYRMPVDGYIIILGCYGILEFINRTKGKVFQVCCVGTYFLFTYFLYKYSLETKYLMKTLMEKIGLWQ